MRRALLNAHLAIALILCLPLVALGLSGSLLVFQNEIDAAFNPLPPYEHHRAPERSVDDIIAAAHVAAPSRPSLRSYTVSPVGVVDVQFASGGKRDATVSDVTIDPHTLAILRVRDPNAGPMRVVHRLHETFLLGQPGRVFVTVLGGAMVVLGLSGIVLWLPRLKRGWAALGVRARMRGFVLYRDIHATFGFWALLVFLTVSVTGTIIAAAPLLAPSPARAHAGGRAAISFSQAARIAMQRYPEISMGSIRRIGFGPIIVSLGNADRSIDVSEDPATGRIVSVSDSQQFTPVQRLQSFVRPLHTGQLGPVWKLLVFAVGFLPLLFTISGIAMWRKRRPSAAG